MKMRANILIVACCLIGLLGCAASFRGGDSAQVGSWPPQSKGVNTQSSALPSLGLNVVVIDLVKDTNEVLPVSPARSAALAELTKRAYRESGFFSDIKSGIAETDIRAEVNIVTYSSSSMAMAQLKGILTGLTLGLVPSSLTLDYVVKTTFYDGEGKELGKIEKAEPYTTWWHLFIVFVAPFNKSDKVRTDLVSDLNRISIIGARSKGII